MATYKELLEEISNLQLEARETFRKETADAKVRILALMSEHGVTIDDVRAETGRTRKTREAKPASPGKSAVPPMYRHPDTGATWSGRGRAPWWIQGHDRSSYLIGQSAH